MNETEKNYILKKKRIFVVKSYKIKKIEMIFVLRIFINFNFIFVLFGNIFGYLL
jgi:hypothetical protein